MSAVFDEYATYYDLLYRDKDYVGEAAYVANVIRTFAPEARCLLELGCGTGGHAFQLVSMGFEVTGVDRSAQMIQRAVARVSEQTEASSAYPRFEVGDLRDYRHNRPVDAIVSLFHVFSYLTEPTDLKAAFRTAAMNLRIGGVLLFDAWHGPGVQADPPSNRTRTFSGGGVEVSRTSRPEHFERDHRVDVHFEISMLSRDQVKRVTEIHPMRYFFIQELEAWLRESGFELLTSNAWMKNVPASSADWYACHVARRTV